MRNIKIWGISTPVELSRSVATVAFRDGQIRIMMGILSLEIAQNATKDLKADG